MVIKAGSEQGGEGRRVLGEGCRGGSREEGPEVLGEGFKGML